MFKYGTLNITRPFWGIGLLAAVLIALIVIGAEALIRIPVVQAQFLLPVLPGHYEVGAKDFVANRLNDKNGTIDCLFIGSSIVGRGVIPDEFSRAYEAQTGQPITCFNFGIDTLNFQGGGKLVQILTKRYHPRFIVFGAHYENFTDSDANHFTFDTPWARSQLGQIDLEGMLESNLLSYREVLTYAQTPEDIDKSRILNATLSPYGYRVSYDVVEAHRLTPDDDPDFFAVIDTMDIAAHRGALADLLALNGQGTQVVLVDMPLARQTANAISRWADLQGYLDALAQEAEAHNVVYIPVIPAELIPENGYQDPSHMNTNGAIPFSAWLGQQLGVAAQQGLIAP